MVSKFEVGVSSGKLKEPPKSCIPKRAKMKMKRKSRNRSDMMDDKAFMRAITRLRREAQYLKNVNASIIMGTLVSGSDIFRHRFD